MVQSLAQRPKKEEEEHKEEPAIESKLASDDSDSEKEPSVEEPTEKPFIEKLETLNYKIGIITKEFYESER